MSQRSGWIRCSERGGRREAGLSWFLIVLESDVICIRFFPYAYMHTLDRIHFVTGVTSSITITDDKHQSYTNSVSMICIYSYRLTFILQIYSSDAHLCIPIISMFIWDTMTYMHTVLFQTHWYTCSTTVYSIRCTGDWSTWYTLHSTLHVMNTEY